MAFLRTRNDNLDSRWRSIAQHYKAHGDAWRVRWDYAFFQMLVETNYLTYRKPAGGMADVHPRQNNFAGIGATGGMPGDSFPNPSIGVLAQIQHLVTYSGERLQDPTAPRTRLKMDEILAKSRALGRSVTFHDLAGRWAVDRAYGRSIEATARAFRSAYCGEQTIASRSGTLRLRPGAGWARPDRGLDQTIAVARSGGGGGGDREQAFPSGPGRLAAGRSTDDDQDERPAARSRRPLQIPLVTRSMHKSETAEPPGPAVKAATARVLPSAPPPIMEAKPPAGPLSEQPATPAQPETKAAAAPRPALSPEKLSTPPAQDAAQPVTLGLPGVSTPASAATATAAGAASPPSPPSTAASAASPATASVPAPPRPAGTCRIFRASYGGPKTVLIQALKDGVANYTLLEVTNGREQEQAKAFMAAHARGGKIIGEFPAEAEALKKSFELCPAG